MDVKIGLRAETIEVHAVVTAFLIPSIAEIVKFFTASQPDWMAEPRD